MEAEEIIRLIDSQTLFALHYNKIPSDRRGDVVYYNYNPVVKQKIKDDKVQFRVKSTAGGNLLSVPYDVSARTADLDVVKILIHSVISSDRKWMTIDIKDYYLGTPLPSTRYKAPISVHSTGIPVVCSSVQESEYCETFGQKSRLESDRCWRTWDIPSPRPSRHPLRQ